MNTSLDRLILYVRDVRKLMKFYRDRLGLSLVEEIDDEWAVLRAGHCELALHRAGQAYRLTAASSSGSNNNAKLVMTVDGLEAVRERLLASGVPMGDIKEYPGFSGPLCDGTDPEGNVFQLAQR